MLWVWLNIRRRLYYRSEPIPVAATRNILSQKERVTRRQAKDNVQSGRIVKSLDQTKKNCPRATSPTQTQHGTNRAAKPWIWTTNTRHNFNRRLREAIELRQCVLLHSQRIEDQRCRWASLQQFIDTATIKCQRTGTSDDAERTKKGAFQQAVQSKGIEQRGVDRETRLLEGELRALELQHCSNVRYILDRLNTYLDQATNDNSNLQSSPAISDASKEARIRLELVEVSQPYVTQQVIPTDAVCERREVVRRQWLDEAIDVLFRTIQASFDSQETSAEPTRDNAKASYVANPDIRASTPPPPGPDDVTMYQEGQVEIRKEWRYHDEHRVVEAKKKDDFLRDNPSATSTAFGPTWFVYRNRLTRDLINMEKLFKEVRQGPVCWRSAAPDGTQAHRRIYRTSS